MVKYILILLFYQGGDFTTVQYEYENRSDCIYSGMKARQDDHRIVQFHCRKVSEL